MAYVDVTNEDRADWAQEALNRFPASEPGENLQNLGDLLVDLLHLARREGVEDIEAYVQGKLEVYREEVREEYEEGSEAESPGLTLTGTQLRQNDSHS